MFRVFTDGEDSLPVFVNFDIDTVVKKFVITEIFHIGKHLGYLILINL